MDVHKEISSTKNHRQLRYLPQSAVLEEGASPQLIMTAICLIAAFVFGFIIWSAVTTIEEVAIADGEVIPAGQIKTIQHLEGGIVNNIFISEGEVVEEDQILLTLSPTGVLPELDRMRTREIATMLDLMRLRAYVNKSSLEKSSFVHLFEHVDDIQNRTAISEMIDDTIELLKFENMNRDDDLAILKLQVEQRQEEALKLDEQRKNIEKYIALLEEEEDIYDKLNSTQSISRITLLENSRQLNKSYGDLYAVMRDQHLTQQSLAEATKRLEAKEVEFNKVALSEIGEQDTQLLEVKMSIRRLMDRVARLNVRAPTRGIVKGLDLDIGSVVPQGGVLMDLVPIDKKLIVEAKLATKDVGHIDIGDKVNVKVSSYDYVRYGQIKGQVEAISASTFLDDDSNPYYKVFIDLEKNYVGSESEHNVILPGMLVVADIVTGDKSLLGYLLKPVHRSFQESFRER